ncbi:MAG: hypothetical protein HY608_07880 [Planctomycetes bacterium]|nr:hypothetical protein [Planctomycetota bacterium]
MASFLWAVALAGGLLSGLVFGRGLGAGGGMPDLPPAPQAEPSGADTSGQDHEAWQAILRVWGPPVRNLQPRETRPPLRLVTIIGDPLRPETLRAGFTLDGAVPRTLFAGVGEAPVDGAGEPAPSLAGWVVSGIRLDRMEVDLVREAEHWVLQIRGGTAVEGPAFPAGDAMVTITRRELGEFLTLSNLVAMATDASQVRWDTIQIQDGGKGVRIDWIAQASPLARFGVRAGDIVVGGAVADLAGVALSVRFRQNIPLEAEEFRKQVESKADTVSELALDVIRSGTPTRIRVRVR